MAQIEIENLSAMAYANGFTLWHYRTQHPIEEVLAPGYFAPCSNRLRTGDFMLLGTGAPPTQLTFMAVYGPGDVRPAGPGVLGVPRPEHPPTVDSRPVMRQMFLLRKTTISMAYVLVELPEEEMKLNHGKLAVGKAWDIAARFGPDALEEVDCKIETERYTDEEREMARILSEEEYLVDGDSVHHNPVKRNVVT